MPPKQVKFNEKKIPPAPPNSANLTGQIEHPHGTDESEEYSTAPEQSGKDGSRAVSPSIIEIHGTAQSHATATRYSNVGIKGNFSVGGNVSVTITPPAPPSTLNPWPGIATKLGLEYNSSDFVLKNVHEEAIKRYKQQVDEIFKNPLDVWSDEKLEELHSKAKDYAYAFVEDTLSVVDTGVRRSCTEGVKIYCETQWDWNQLDRRNQQGMQACKNKLDEVCSQFLKDYISNVRSELKFEQKVTLETFNEACAKFKIPCEQEFATRYCNLWGFCANILQSKLEEGSNQLESELKRSNRLHEYRQEIIQEAEKSYHTRMENCKAEEDLHTLHDSSMSFVIQMIKSCRLDTHLKESVIGALQQRGDTLISDATSAFQKRFEDEKIQLAELRERICATYLDKMKASTSAEDPLDDDVLLKLHEDAKDKVRLELRPEISEILKLVTLQLKEEIFIGEINYILDDQFKSFLRLNGDKWHRFEEKVTEDLEEAKKSYRTKLSVAIIENLDIETFQVNEFKSQEDAMKEFERLANPGFDGQKLKIFKSAAEDLQAFFQEEKERCLTILQFQQRIDELAAKDALRQTNVLYLEKLKEFLQAKYWYEEDELQSLGDCVIQESLGCYTGPPLTPTQIKIFQQLRQTSKDRDPLIDAQRRLKKEDDEYALQCVREFFPSYSASMDTAMTLKPYHNPQELENVHRDAYDAVEVCCEDERRSTPNEEKIFREEINNVFRRYRNLNKCHAVKAGLAVGIVLGSENSHAAIFLNDKLIVLDERCDEGEKTGIPSYICFGDNNQVSVGKLAKKKTYSISVRQLKKLIGTQFKDKVVEEDQLKNRGYTITYRDNKACLKVRYTEYSPEEMYAKLLFKLKQIAEKYASSTVTRAVIAVPSYLNSAQRQGVKDAANIAKFQTIIMDYPMAGAYLAIKYLKPDYTSKQSQVTNRNLLLFHLTRSSTRISVVNVSGENTTILADKCSKNLGWNNFHLNMVREILRRVKIPQPSDTEINTEIYKSLSASCEEGMEALKLTTVRVVGSVCQININEIFTRNEFDNVNQRELELCLEHLGSALLEAKLWKHDIQDVRLSGLSSRVPSLKERVSSYFDGKQLSFDENSIVAGAAFQAAMLQDHDWAAQSEMIRNLTPSSLSVSCNSNPIFTIVPSKTAIPCSFTKARFCLYNPCDPAIEIQLYEGDTEPMTVIASFSVAGNPNAPSGIQEVQITVKISDCGVLSVEANVLGGGVRVYAVDSYSDRFKAVGFGMSSADIEAAKKKDLLRWPERYYVLTG